MPVLVAIVTAEPTRWEGLSRIISSCGLCPVRCETLAAAIKLIAQHHVELVLCDDELPDGNFRQLIAYLRSPRQLTPVVVISHFDDWGSYLDAMTAGAFEYVAFPPYPQELEQAVAAALAESQACQQVSASAN